MGETIALSERLRKGLAKIDSAPAGIHEPEALKTLRRSVEMTIAREETGAEGLTRFRFQFTGGKALLLQGNEALPMEPDRLFRLLNDMDIVLKPGESLDLDGGMAAWLIHPEVAVTDTNLRHAEENLRVLKSNRDNRDHGAIQASDSTRIRLRSRMTQLVAALQMAQSTGPEVAPRMAPLIAPTAVKRETAVRPAPPPAPTPAPVQRETAVKPAPPPPPPPPPKTEITAPPPPAPAEGTEETPAAEKKAAPMADVLSKALRKIVAAIDGCGFRSAVIGDIAHLCWGFKDLPVWGIELIVAIGETQRETLLSAARGEGLFMAAGADGSMSLRYIDKKQGASVNVELIEAMSPHYREIVARAKPDFVLDSQIRVASVEDLIVLRAGSEEPGHRESIIHLLRTCANRIDPTYLKAMAQKFDVLDELKGAWQEAKKPVDAPTEASGS